ncbi:MAG TPA: hypothetical protein PK927_11155, partial [Smithellaceae bacterium]|nr:hypothetical protein [Smithellaceae bacterium]
VFLKDFFCTYSGEIRPINSLSDEPEIMTDKVAVRYLQRPGWKLRGDGESPGQDFSCAARTIWVEKHRQDQGENRPFIKPLKG